MRLPFVSRARYDAVCHQLAGTVREEELALVALATLRDETVPRERLRATEQAHAKQIEQLSGFLAREAGRVDALTKVILRMKSTGAVLLPPESVQATRGPARVQTPIEQAIDNNPRARGNPGLARHLFNWAAQAKRDEMPEEDVLEKLRSWGAPTHDEDEAEDALSG